MERILATVLLIAIVIVSIMFHEVAHGVAALWFGDTTAQRAGRLTLNPIPHIDPLGSILLPFLGLFFGGFIFGWAKPVPFNPANFNKNPRLGLFSVAIAGVSTNFVLAFLAAIAARVLAANGQADIAQFMMPIVVLNCILGIFNLIPIPPLDGSKVVYAMLNLSSAQQMRIEMMVGGFTGFLILIMLLMFGALSPIFHFAYSIAHFLLHG